MAHNVQAAPDGRTVWLTAMPNMEGGAHGADMPEELIGVDAAAYEVTSRIELGIGATCRAHVVISGDTGFVTANEADAVVVVDLAAKTVSRTISLPDGTGPRCSPHPDGRVLVVAGMGDGSLVLVDVASGDVTRHDLPGRAVQTAVLPDGSAAFATVYDTRQVARIDLTTQVVTLPSCHHRAQGQRNSTRRPIRPSCGSRTKDCSTATPPATTSSLWMRRPVRFTTSSRLIPVRARGRPERRRHEGMDDDDREQDSANHRHHDGLGPQHRQRRPQPQRHQLRP